MNLLERELALLDRARQQLRVAPAEALATLQQHQREFPKGSLRVEASIVRVETLLQLGRRAEAEALARELVRAEKEKDGLVRRRLGKLLDAGVP